MKPLKDRIVSSMEVDTVTGCWNWKKAKVGSKKIRSYGKITIGTKHVDRKNALAHRVSFTVFKGEIPDGYQVMHTCDNPSCVNPDHLTLGTNQDNVNDREAKGRTGGWAKRKVLVNNCP